MYYVHNLTEFLFSLPRRQCEGWSDSDHPRDFTACATFELHVFQVLFVFERSQTAPVRFSSLNNLSTTWVVDACCIPLKQALKEHVALGCLHWSVIHYKSHEIYNLSPKCPHKSTTPCAARKACLQLHNCHNIAIFPCQAQRRRGHANSKASMRQYDDKISARKRILKSNITQYAIVPLTMIKMFIPNKLVQASWHSSTKPYTCTR